MSKMGMAMMGTGSAKGEDRATVAAEAAINSPLLEDVDLKGASGILVNITAGLDLSLGEFTEVGNIVEEYASDDATIVVGTVIDPEMTDDIKVTVVATGFDKRAEPVKVVAPTHKRNDGSVNFNQIELPTVLRRQKQEALLEPSASKELKSDKQQDVEMLDIPTYIRRQAD
jgi:cell division protein FtsZ